MVDVGDAVVEFCELAAVPAVGCTHEVAGDALQLVNMAATALRTDFQMVVGVFVTAVHAAVAVVVDAAVTHVQTVHHINDRHDDLGIVGSIAVDLDIEDVATACQLMIGCLHLCLMAGRALIVNGHVVGVGVVVAVGDSLQRTELLTVALGKLSCQSLCGGSQYGIIMVILVAELVDSP